MRYIALLRGINISGKNKIPMAELKEAFTECGFSEVKTHLNSGNVVFDSREMPEKDIAACISKMIKERFELDIPVFVMLRDELTALLGKAPNWWGNEDKEIYDNLIFLMHDYNALDIASKIGEPTEGLEKIEICDNAVFWSFNLEKHAKANWWKKTAMPGIGEYLTIRTANTCRKICKL